MLHACQGNPVSTSVTPVPGPLSDTTISEHPAAYVRRHGTVLAEYGDLTQDSGNVSWLVDVDGRRLFVKTAGSDSPPRPGAPVPYFDHAGRVRLLRNAVDLASSCDHPALARLLNVVESPDGPVLVYEAAAGELVRVPEADRDDPSSAYQRFAHLPAGQLLAVFEVLVDLHVALAEAGWVAGDLYDGCLILDFETSTLTVIDLDSYRRGPSVNDMGRMFGSSRFMAPEELELGAVIDERTTVHTLGRLVWHFCTRLTERADDFCGPPALADVVRRSCQPSPADRYPSVASFATAWAGSMRPTTSPREMRPPPVPGAE
jgi:serine/threonine-protein kinase